MALGPLGASSETDMPDQNDASRDVLPANKARQGRSGWRVLAVLVAALILALLAWWAAEFYGRAIEPVHPPGDTSTVPPTQ